MVASWSRDPEFGPVPEWLSAVADAALADMQRPAPIDVQLGFDPDEGILWVSEAGESGKSGFEPWSEARGVGEIVRLADWLQEQFFPETRGAWGEARPGCPGHPHPAEAVEIEGEAWWVCPVDGRRIAAIGQIGE